MVALFISGGGPVNTANVLKGFFKKAEESPSVISDWFAEAAAATKKVKTKTEDKKVDPRSLSEWQGPEAWHRYWT